MSNVQESITDIDANVLVTAAKSLYLNEKAADVYFVLKSGERIPAHRTLLVGASKVFDTMFYGSVPEKGDVKIVDASAGAFMEFLQFFYFTKVQLTMKNVQNVMYLGNKYDVADCMDVCVKFLQSNITADNVCYIYGLAIMHDQRKLEWKCEEVISQHTQEVLKSPIFLECSKPVLEHILKLDHLSCSEVDVFKACMSWVKAVSEQNELTKEIVQEHLGHLFYEIGFKSMTNDEFVDLLPVYGKLFTVEELDEIFQMINKEYESKQFKGNDRINLRQKWKEHSAIYCEISSEVDSPYLIGNVDITRFTVNKALLLGAIAWTQLFKNGDEELFEYDVPVEVTIATVADRTHNKTSEGKVIWNCKFKLCRFSLTEIKLPTPILICPEVEYEIRTDLQQSVWSTTTRCTEKQLTSGIHIKFNSHAGENVKEIKVLIRYLSFNRVI